MSMATRSRWNPAAVLAVIGLVAAVLVALPAFAPSAGAARAHEYGQMVDYPLTFPVAGENSYFDSFWDPRASGTHHAQDLMAAKMVPVVAAASGTVERVNWSRNPDDLAPAKCCSITLRHDDGWESWYIHLNNDNPGTDDGQGWGIAPGILPGTHVEAGELLGWVGDSGNAEGTAPHLHFELYDANGTVVNPYESLRAAETGAVSACIPSGTADFSDLLNTSRILRNGTRGEDVADLQRFLTAAGFDPGPDDGAFGPLTEAGVRAFQADKGLVVDGIVGSQTLLSISRLTGTTGVGLLAALDPGGRVLQIGFSGNDVVTLQQWLRIAGFDPGPPDGLYGPLTAAAVRSFQEEHSLTVDGKVGPQTRGTLADALGLTAIRTCA
jgi:peptidoglycan hydrolase-like protein with peptidoglycan-binding domain